MNICFFIYNCSRSNGSERTTTVIANSLSESHNVHILSICGKPYVPWEINKKIKISVLYNNELEINHKRKYFNIVKKLYKYYKNNKIEISIEVFTSLSLFTLPVKIFYKFKNISWEHYNYHVSSGMNRIARKISCIFSNAIVTLTNEDKNEYIRNEKMIKAKLEYIYNPIPFSSTAKSDVENKIVISAGRLTFQKGYDMLIKAWKIVEKQRHDWKLLIAGDGEERESLENLCKKLDIKNLIFKGLIKDMSEFYLGASIYVSSSRFEGLPMTLIEAESFGLPIVAFNCKTGPSEIIKNNINGFLVENNNITELAEKILILINDKQLRKNFSYNTDISKFYLSGIKQKWLDLIELLI